jgi:hypothetical protein
MILGIGDIERLACEGYALRRMELGLLVGAIGAACFAGPDNGANLALKVGFEQAMMTGVANNQAIGRRIYGQLARKG